MYNSYSDKQELRQSLRKQRRSASPKVRRLFRHSILTQVQPIIRRLKKVGKKNIGLFIPMFEEVPVDLLARTLSQQGNNILYPIVRPSKALQFKPRSFNYCNYRKSKLGVWELKAGLGISVEKLSVLLMPLVAFDKTGKRLGMGGGFYDRTLGSRGCRHVIRYGIAYELQRVRRIPSDSWDMALDGILTERRCYYSLHKNSR